MYYSACVHKGRSQDFFLLRQNLDIIAGLFSYINFVCKICN